MSAENEIDASMVASAISQIVMDDLMQPIGMAIRTYGELVNAVIRAALASGLLVPKEKLDEATSTIKELQNSLQQAKRDAAESFAAGKQAVLTEEQLFG